MFWISPVTYCQEALAYSEMSAPRWQTPTTINGRTQPLGMWVLESRDLFTDSYWVYMGALVLIGYAIIFNLGTFLALSYLPGECTVVVRHQLSNVSQLST